MHLMATFEEGGVYFFEVTPSSSRSNFNFPSRQPTTCAISMGLDQAHGGSMARQGA